MRRKENSQLNFLINLPVLSNINIYTFFEKTFFLMEDLQSWKSAISSMSNKFCI